MAFSLDTHAAVRNLEKHGFEPAQAEAIVSTISNADARVDLVTKADLANAVNKMLMMQIAIAALLFAALKLFP